MRSTLSSASKRKDNPTEEPISLVLLRHVVVGFARNYGIAGGLSVGVRGSGGNLGIFISNLRTINP